MNLKLVFGLCQPPWNCPASAENQSQFFCFGPSLINLLWWPMTTFADCAFTLISSDESKFLEDFFTLASDFGGSSTGEWHKCTNCQTVLSGWKWIFLGESICVIFSQLPDRREAKWLWERGRGFPWWKTWVVGCYIDYNSLACLSTREPENAFTSQDAKEDTDDIKVTSQRRALYPWQCGH